MNKNREREMANMRKTEIAKTVYVCKYGVYKNTENTVTPLKNPYMEKFPQVPPTEYCVTSVNNQSAIDVAYEYSKKGLALSCFGCWPRIYCILAF